MKEINIEFLMLYLNLSCNEKQSTACEYSIQ